VPVGGKVEVVGSTGRDAEACLERLALQSFVKKTIRESKNTNAACKAMNI